MSQRPFSRAAAICATRTERILSPRVMAPCGIGVLIQKKQQRTQHGVKALDGGDADAADAVELRGLGVLDGWHGGRN